MNTWSFLLWFLDHWLLILWGAGVVVGYIYGGRTTAIAIFTLGVGIIAYNKGKEAVNERAKKVEGKRENAYKDIDNRGTNRADVIERLRKHDF